VLLFQLSRYLFWKQSCLDVSALRILFEVHLAFSDRAATPTEELVAPSALNVSTRAVLHQLKILPAIVSRALSRAVFEKYCCEQLFGLLVPLDDVSDAFDLSQLLIMVDSVDRAAAKGVIAILTPKTEHEVAMLALAHVELFVDRSQVATSIERTPTDVIHLRDCMLD